ncbi:hypothetical protein H4O18_17850 [Arenibacter sp. BSSL-BM3]|uniref:Uncharacterized protein n=1 Tax=Arenibacter arenosicollis TaxID=2762274 RepID=A0ABR7QRT0_9FLAO|nr:hypothetical protein [Arenibacter arenosicollis]MBC8769868.1 hypothetical protein [Arenibacter arenosicollis]
MDTWKENNFLYRILGKLKSFLRPIYYNGTSVTVKERESALALQTILLELNNIKLISKNEDIVPS